MEIRRANKTRFDVYRRATQECWMHVVFSGPQIHFWYIDKEMPVPKQLFALGYIDYNFVAFEWDVLNRDDYVEEKSPADPKFFEWLESCIKRIIKEAQAKNVGPVRET